MADSKLNIVVIGLSITSSWGNGHASTYRGLVRELCVRGHDVLFLERDVPWYANNRDLPVPPYGTTRLYADNESLFVSYEQAVREADLVIVGSYVMEGVAVGKWALEQARGVVAFYDIDTPVTLEKLARGDEEYLSKELVGQYALYLSFTGGPTLERIEREYGSPMARALYCSADLDVYRPLPSISRRWELGYLGTYSADRQPRVEELLCRPARMLERSSFVVAGPQYPTAINWSKNVARVEHVAPPEHPAFYAAQRFALNITRDDMIAAGYSPSIRLFEAAACGVPVISDRWAGIDTFFRPGDEILLAQTGEEVVEYLEGFSEEERDQMGRRARERVLYAHTARHRVLELEQYVNDAASRL